MRRIFGTILSAALALGLVLPAGAVGEVTGHLYATDIVAKIDGHPLRSYNLGDATLVVAEDLREYGFSVIWDEASRTLRVERDRDSGVTGAYQPPAQTRPVGTRVGNIYATDIRTYVQGEQVESYNIGGETAIRFSELGRTGTFTWSGEERISALTLAEDPMEFALEQLEADVDSWKEAGGSSSSYARYPNAAGTLFVGYYSGTPRGGSYQMVQVSSSGWMMDVAELLPNDPASYFAPREVQVDETGQYVTFTTPIREGETTGEFRCTLDVSVGALSWERLPQVGDAYYTDVQAEINGYPIPAYDVEGRIAVPVEHLFQYGFYVYQVDENGRIAVWPEALEPGGPWEKGEPDYVPQPPAGEVGSPMAHVYLSNRDVQVAGEKKTALYLEGQTLIYLDDLTAYGDLSWDESGKLVRLTLAEDVVELALERKEAELKEAGLPYTMERYPGSRGTLAVYTQSGTPHGNACMMLYVDESGQQTRVDMLLPGYGFGAQYYLQPRDIQWNGVSYTFITPVKSETDGQGEDWGDCLCEFHAGGRTLQMTRQDRPLEEWSGGSGSSQGTADPAAALTMTVTREPGAYEATVEQANVPSEYVGASVRDTGITIVHTAGFHNLTGAEDWAVTPYQQAYQALEELDLPRVTQENFSSVNSPELREQAAQWFQVTLNGTPVSGDLWWSQGNNHIDLNFTYDQPIQLAEGDVVCLWIGVPKEK